MSALSSAAGILARCPAGCAVTVEVVAETGSTNADLLERTTSLAGPALLIAGQQNAGRGRAGRSWLSAPGSTLMFSLAWKFKGPLHRLVGLPLAAGVALAEALTALGVPVRLKWPNDLLKDGAKLAGILVETQAAPDGGVWAVIGAGINLLMPDELEARIGHGAACAPWLAAMDRDELMAALLARLVAVLTEFDAGGFSPFRARWNLLHAHQGQSVAILDHGKVLQQGRAAGVDRSGCLLLDTAGGRIEILSGDVSLRPAAP
jgi:BirA family biotin operon repressor/biotin-[acetyl-CoA-carboxylase] ligase